MRPLPDIATFVAGCYLALAFSAFFAVSAPLFAADQAPKFTQDQLDFFVREVKPILKANCISCHGAEKKVQSDFHITTRAGLLAGSENGRVVYFDKPDQSPLLEAINFRSYEMPPKGKLPQAQIDTLTRWVKMGLPWPEGEPGVLVHHGPPVVDEAARNFWSFKPVVRPALPSVKNTAWIKTPVDVFILAKLDEKNLQPATPASKTALLRRVHYSVTGLPPTTDEITAFLADSSPDAYEKVIEKLLESRHYGEHWGRHWLDLVRYAETNSFERDNPKPFVWRYRDYVIRSFNADKPYDQFLREQLAGDELDEVTSDSLIATGYYRLGLWDDEPVDKQLAYYDGLDDILSTTAQSLLGLTVGCCRCHDHKIDPIPQRDYYRFLAFFHGLRQYENGGSSLRSIASPEAQAREQAVAREHQEKLAAIAKEMDEIEAILRPHLPGGEIDDFKHEPHKVPLLTKYSPQIIDAQTLARYKALKKEDGDRKRNPPRSQEQALAATEEGRPRDTFILLRGNPQSQGDRVEPGFPSVLTAATTPDPILPKERTPQQTAGRRKVLADWIASPQNPLTARVLVNRVWQYHFGRGIVRSSSNFGYMGTPPTHPELLDWLAAEFIQPTANGNNLSASGGRQPPESWSLKHLHRLILTSNAFRMSSHADPAAAKIDPENVLLSHFDLRRLSAEELRDSILAASGNLNLNKIEGPSIYPTIPAEVLAGQSQPGKGWEKSSPEDAASRSVFVHIKRSLGLPILVAFDAPDPDAPCPIRFTTTQPTQALGMLNGAFVNSQAGVFAKLANGKFADNQTEQVRFVLSRVLQREPTKAEIDRSLKFLADVREADSTSDDEALRQFCLLALNLNEFVYLE